MGTKFYFGEKPLLSQPSIGGGLLGRAYIGGNKVYGGDPPPPTWGTPPSQDANCWMFWDASDTNCYPGTGTAITDLKGNSNGTIVGSDWTFETQNDLGVLRNSQKGNNHVTTEAYSGVNTANTFEMFWYSSQAMSGDGAMAEWKGGSTSYDTIFEANIQQFSSPRRAYFYLSGESGSPRGGDVIKDMSITQNTWYHMVVTAGRSSNNKLYINGVLEDTGTPTYSSTETWLWDQGGYMFGFYNSNKEWIGDWAVFRAYNAELSQAEVTANYNYYIGKTT